MSKILKIIVNTVVLMAIVIAAALLVPPFTGLDTVMNDNTQTETNLPVGSVAYGKSISLKELEKKDKIIYNDGSSAYVYEITDMDASAGVYTVKDIYNKNSDEESVTLQKTVPKVLVVVPFIGYAAIALQSKEGLIVIGLGILFLIILFILSEIWRKDDDDEEDEEEDDEDEDDSEEDEEERLSRKERRRLKKEEKRRRREQEYEEDGDEDEEEDDDEEEKLSRKERRRLKKEEKRRRKLEKKGLLEDEEKEEETSSAEESAAEGDSPEIEDVLKDAMSVLTTELAQMDDEGEPESAEAIADEPSAVQDTEALEKALESMLEPEALQEELQDNNIEETEEEEFVVDVNAVPRTPTLEELLAKAQAAGEEPEVMEDEENKITLLDYSDIL